ncbi:Methyltransferase [Heracleum sosnowskyi]|uniref:Methyltransferase n=1 Tax=Heracleum sosnowskyi TaxID=360622 RepID=A0AAD8LZW2_9APIA|nr:Methyltransferase [Heracleum sosnowskyi]
MVEIAAPKRTVASNIIVRLFSFILLIFFAKFAFILTVNSGDYVISAADYVTSAAEKAQILDFYTSVFENLIAERFIDSHSKSLCLEPRSSEEIVALRDVGVENAIGVSRKRSLPLILQGTAVRQPFDDDSFDFVFSGVFVLERSNEPVKFAVEVSRTLKPGGFFVVHTKAIDSYSLNSLLELFNCCILIDSREINGLDFSRIREVVLMKGSENLGLGENDEKESTKCYVPHYKRELIRNLEPLISEEPLKPWITLKRNVRNIRYVSSMIDISFKNRYVYVDVGARSYGSSIGGWFQKFYPKQDKAFDIYAIEADKAFYKEYKSKKRVTLLPYAAWVRNESLFFEINRKAIRKTEEKGRGLGKDQAVLSTWNFVTDLDRIMGFDFANWLKNTVSETDFVVVKMDVEGAEFHLIPKLVETGAICLIDEMFLACHYNRWKRCCPGMRISKYPKTYAECLNLFSSLREKGIPVHQWR